MAKFPEPPPVTDLAAITPAVRALPAGTRLWRIYFQAGPHPTTWNAFRHFGPITRSRFDHHLPPPATQARGILYASPDGNVPFAEVFQEDRTIDRVRDGPWLVAFDLKAPVEVLWYRSSMGGKRPAVALYEGATPALPARPVFHRALADSALTPIVLRAAGRFGYAVVA